MSIINQIKYVFIWQFHKNSGYLIFFAILQTILALGIVIGFNYLLSNPGQNEVLFLATGAPTIVLITTGLVMLPQQNSSAKTEGYIDFMRTWPINRGAIMIADTIIWLLITIPAIGISSIFAHFVYQPGFDVSWTILPALLLTALTSIGIGYGFSFVLPQNATMMLTQLLVFGSLMFSPINFPMENLPSLLQSIHRVLPLYSMAEVVRGSLAQSTFTVDFSHYIILSAWCLLGYITSIKILNRN
ncbi:ABC-2 type transport system permease protein [Natranaerovirga hydrolytica]|uniref:ABC-2 type transport system permease protein n=1 Tax=Natranaerovirga hydrolytica TaxID=680378 RepID=A0A4R1MMT8_9FIRM|nr:ABC transporter permease [Natranaerovirga hydrolytica]TCK93212.1 ABC-2 type transport system permease protein [Natranaerovirga hydrolytica]